MDELDKEANEAHNRKSDSSCESDLLEFLSIGFGAFFDKSERILEELPTWLDYFIDLVHFDVS